MTEIVRNTAQLTAAVTNQDVTYIVFGEDIELTSPITIPPDKLELVFDGEYEGVKHTFTDRNFLLDSQTLGVRSTSDIELTFKNMDMVGRNYYGIPFVSESADTAGVTVIYENITYTGPQLTFNPNGLTRYINCDITINYPADMLRVEEVGEVNRVEFEGVNIIRHHSLSSLMYSVFWFRGTVGTAYLKVMPGAEVTVTTTNYFMFNLIPVLSIPTTPNPVTCEIQQGASLDITSYRGFTYETPHRVASFLVDTDANFRYVQQSPHSSHASMNVNGDFIVNSGASVYMESDFDNAYPLINFAAGTAESLSINNPKSFVTYNKASVPIALASGVTRSFTLSGGQINFWTSAMAFPQAGTLVDTPYRKWNRPGWGEFNITGTVTSGGTNATGTSLTPDEQALMPPLNELVFQTARVISVGNLPLSTELIADDGRLIVGSTDPEATVLITFSVPGTDYSSEMTAGANGAFLDNPQMMIPADTVVTIKSNVPFLITEIKVTVVAAQGEIIIQKTPELIEFKLPSVITSPEPLLGRADPLDAVEVLDLRPVPTVWNLLVSVTEPLTAPGGEVLEDALVFRDTNGNIFQLSDTPITVYTGVAAQGQVNVAWTAQYGILVRGAGPIRSGVTYSATLNWELQLP